jgi:hypothetical protein
LQVSPWKIANIICEYKNCEAFRKKFLTWGHSRRKNREMYYL